MSTGNTNTTTEILYPQIISYGTRVDQMPASSGAYPILNDQQPVVRKAWHEKAIDTITQVETSISTEIGTNQAQVFFDKIGKKIESRLKSTYNDAMELIKSISPDLAGRVRAALGANHKHYNIVTNLAKLADFLITLPFKAAHNITKLLYQILKAAAQGLVHPVEAAAKLAKLIVKMVHALTKLETWTMMGAGMVGAGFAQLALGNVAAPIAIILGAIIMAGGLTVGTVMAAVNEKVPANRKDAALNYFIKTGKEIPESMATGFLMGLILGAIEKAATKTDVVQTKNTKIVKTKMTDSEIEKLAREHAQQNFDTPVVSRIVVDSENITSYTFYKYHKMQGVSIPYPKDVTTMTAKLAKEIAVDYIKNSPLNFNGIYVGRVTFDSTTRAIGATISGNQLQGVGGLAINATKSTLVEFTTKTVLVTTPKLTMPLTTTASLVTAAS